MPGKSYKYKQFYPDLHKGNKKTIAQLEKIEKLIRKTKNIPSTGKGLKKTNQLYNESAKIQTEILKISKLQKQRIKEVNAERKKELNLNKRNKEALNLKLQTEKQELILKKKLIRDQAKLNAQKKLGVRANRGLIKSLGRLLLAYVGFFAVIRLFQNILNVFKSFEKSSKKLQAILGATEKEMKALTEQAKKLGAVTAFTASEILGLHTELAKLGFELPQIEAMTKGILALAAATGADLSSAAELAGATIRIFGLNASEAGRVADVLALSTSKSALTMEKLATALPTVGTTAKQAGLNLEQTVALLGTLSNRGLDASTSATSLRMIFIKLASNGLTFNEAMTKINKSTNKTKTAFDLFGARAATAAVILSETEVVTRDLELALDDASGAAQEMADVMLDNLAGDITIAKSAWEGFVLSIEDGDGVISTSLRNVIGFVTLLLGKLTELNRFGFAAAKNTVKIAEANIENWKKTIEFSSEAIKKRKLEGFLFKIENDLLAERNKRKELAGKLATKENRDLGKLHDEQIKRLKIEKQLLVELSATGFFEGQTKSIIENTDATDGNTDATNKNKNALKEKNEVIKETIKLYTLELEKANIGTERFAAILAETAEKLTTDAAGKQGGSILEKFFGTDTDLKTVQKRFQLISQTASNFLTALDNQKDVSLKKDRRRKKISKGIDLTAAIINTAVAVTGAIKANASAGVIAQILAGLAVGAFGASQVALIAGKEYFKGTEYLEFGNYKRGRDTIPFMGPDGSINMASGGERIVDTKINKELGGFPNPMLPTAVNYYRNAISQNNNINVERLLSEQNGILRNSTDTILFNNVLYEVKDGTITGKKTSLKTSLNV